MMISIVCFNTSLVRFHIYSVCNQFLYHLTVVFMFVNFGFLILDLFCTSLISGCRLSFFVCSISLSLSLSLGLTCFDLYQLSRLNLFIFSLRLFYVIFASHVRIHVLQKVLQFLLSFYLHYG